MKNQVPPGMRAFTLIELLVVIGIVGILAVVASYAAKSTMERSNSLRCLSSMRDVGVAMHLFIGENGGRLPGTSHRRAGDGSSLSWTHTLTAYLSDSFISRCPTSQSTLPVTYGWNDWLAEPSSATNAGEGVSYLNCSTPAHTFVIAEVSNPMRTDHFHFRDVRNRVTFNTFKSSVQVDLHGTGSNFLFVDGHVESLSSDEVRARLSPANTTFIKPYLP